MYGWEELKTGSLAIFTLCCLGFPEHMLLNVFGCAQFPMSQNSMKKFQKFYTCFLQKGIILLSCLGTNISPTPVVEFDCKFSLFLKYYSFIYLFFSMSSGSIVFVFQKLYFILVVKIIDMEFFIIFIFFHATILIFNGFIEV